MQRPWVRKHRHYEHPCTGSWALTSHTYPQGDRGVPPSPHTYTHTLQTSALTLPRRLGKSHSLLPPPPP